MEYALEAQSLHVNFGKAPILWDITLEIPKGLLVAVLGPNGAGKSTLLKTALGLVKPLSGKIDLFAEKKAVAYVPQRESVDWDFPVTAFDVVLMGRYGKLKMFGKPRKADFDAAEHALALVGMTAFKDRQISQLSGGQQQRLFIARAFVQNPEIYLLDEPFAGVDLATEKAIVALLKKERERGKSIFVVHHDLPTVKEYFNWVILLNTRLIGAGPIEEAFTQEKLEKTFGKREPLFVEAARLSIQKAGGELE